MTPHVLTAVTGRIGRITLNRPAKINALNLEMIAAVRRALAEWADAPEVAAVLIDGAGERGLCAGGDIAALYDAIRSESAPPEGFWSDEYRMNLEIATYPKPVIAVMHGITFGGGIGVAGHASHRIVTDTSLLAMPETGIGLAPDVGGLYLLARTPGEFGTHAALTGARIGAGDAIAAGLADHFIPSGRIPELLPALAAAPDRDGVINAVKQLAAPVPGAELAGQTWIDECYAGDDAEVILARLRVHDDPAARKAADSLAAMSPTAVAVTLRAIRRAKFMTLSQVLEQDLRLSTAFAAHHDFPEGIRAQIIDKDRNPRWRPATLAGVTAADVDTFFAD